MSFNISSKVVLNFNFASCFKNKFQSIVTSLCFVIFSFVDIFSVNSIVLFSLGIPKFIILTSLICSCQLLIR